MNLFLPVWVLLVDEVKTFRYHGFATVVAVVAVVDLGSLIV